MYNMCKDMHTHVRMDMCMDMCMDMYVLLCTIPLPTPEDSAAASVLFN